MSEQHITLVLADDHPMFRHGLRSAIEDNTSYTIIGEASNGEAAYRLITEKLPTIALLDIEMPKLNGLEVAQRLGEEECPVKLIILTMYEEYSFFNKAIDAGVKGYIIKESAVNDILAGISEVAEGRYYFSPSMSGNIMQRTMSHGSRPHSASDLEKLTPMERKVLHLIAESLSSREIAERLSVTLRTIETHRYNIAHKLGLNGSYALLRFALSFQNKI